MGRVAVAGGSGNIASIVMDAILAEGNHEIVILSRKVLSSVVISTICRPPLWDQLGCGSDAVLSFVTNIDGDGALRVEKRLIDAAIEAGVKRFAPSQWAAKSKSGIAHYAFKDRVLEYLAKVSFEKKVIEYSLFQPGFFTDYLAYPHKPNPKYANLEMMLDFENRRAIILAGSENSPITLTTVSDLALVVTEALDYPDEWPVVGGMQGSQTTLGKVISLGEKLRGPFEVTHVDPEKATKGEYDTPWYPVLHHPSMTDETLKSISKWVMGSYVTATASGGWSVTDEWNKASSIKLTSMEDFLTKVWG